RERNQCQTGDALGRAAASDGKPDRGSNAGRRCRPEHHYYGAGHRDPGGPVHLYRPESIKEPKMNLFNNKLLIKFLMGFIVSWGMLSGCAGPATSITKSGGGSSHLLVVPFFADDTDQCGPSTLASVLNYWGISAKPGVLKKEVYLPQLRGTLPIDMLLAA